MRVLWCVRRDLTAHPGGDTTQIIKTAEAVRSLGTQVDISEDMRPHLEGYDLAHLFHLDRLWENEYHARRLVAARVPFVLSTIWWPASEFDASAREGLQGALARTFGSGTYASLRVVQRAAMHALQSRSLRFAHSRLLHFRNAARYLLEHASVILPNSVAEQIEIERAFGMAPACVVVPNAADGAIFAMPENGGMTREGVLCVGRIEPRKNQLNLIRAVRDSEISLTLVGPVGRFNQRYADRCRAEAGTNVRFLGSQDATGLRKLYQAARVHACVSWYETPGLASMEAALCGCELVVTPGGCTREYFDGHAEFAEPGAPASIRRAIENAMSRSSAAQLAARIREDYSWEAAARATVRAYEEALRARKNIAAR
ncbi:MAG: glycosyltransferase family 4 protein [Phycisphaerae bacterium]